MRALHHMTKATFAVLPLVLLLSRPALAEDKAWPQLDGGNARSGVCGEALALATKLYQSDNFYLYALPDPVGIPSTFALRQEALHTSNGDALVADTSVFQKIPQPANDLPSPRSIYWQIEPYKGLRYVMSEEAYGWRGDQYTLFAIGENMTTAQFFEGETPGTSDRGLLPVIGDTWRPPLMMRELGNGAVWAIDVGPPYVTFSDWKVYSIGQDGAKQRCTVRFHGPEQLGPALLPKPVQRLAALLDASLDDQDDGGTMHFVSGLRQYIHYLWSNIALRPRAIVKENPDTSRATADTELGEWSEAAPRLRKLRVEVLDQLPKAQKALAEFYKGNDTKAQEALDIAFRSYFSKP